MNPTRDATLFSRPTRPTRARRRFPRAPTARRALVAPGFEPWDWSPRFLIPLMGLSPQKHPRPRPRPRPFGPSRSSRRAKVRALLTLFFSPPSPRFFSAASAARCRQTRSRNAARRRSLPSSVSGRYNRSPRRARLLATPSFRRPPRERKRASGTARRREAAAQKKFAPRRGTFSRTKAPTLFLSRQRFPESLSHHPSVRSSFGSL